MDNSPYITYKKFIKGSELAIIRKMFYIMNFFVEFTVEKSYAL